VGRFFGPTAEVVSGAGFFRGSAAPASVGWTAQTIATTAGAFNSNVAAGGGVALLVDTNQALWRSTDGGVTWAATGHSFVNGPYSIAFAADTFILLNSANTAFGSTDGGLTWTAGEGVGLNGANPAGDGSGNWLTGSVVNLNTSSSPNDGISWTAHVIAGSGNHVVSLIWDGTQWVDCSGNGNQIATSPTGTVWTRHTLVPSGDLFNNTLVFQGGTYLANVFNGTSNAVRSASTPAGICTASDVDTGLTGNPSSGLQCLLGGNGVWWAFDSAGGAAVSADTLTWTAVPLNFQAGDFPGTVFQAYDSVHHTFIAIGAVATSISTIADSVS
jgi:hypothetical protein